MEDMIGAAMRRGEQITPEKLYAWEKGAQKNRSLGQTSGSRLVTQRGQNLEVAGKLLDDLEKTNRALDYSDVQFAGALEKWKNGQLNDPTFTEYMTQRADALFVLANAFKQNGVTDKSIEIEEEAFRPTLSPKAFAGWVNAQRRALNSAANTFNRDYGATTAQVETFPAGQGGAPTPAAPKPTFDSSKAERLSSDNNLAVKQYNALKSGQYYYTPDGVLKQKR